MAAFENLGTVSYWHSVATMAVSLAVSTQYANVTDSRQTDSVAYRTPRWYGIVHYGKLILRFNVPLNTL